MSLFDTLKNRISDKSYYRLDYLFENSLTKRASRDFFSKFSIGFKPNPDFITFYYSFNHPISTRIPTSVYKDVYLNVKVKNTPEVLQKIKLGFANKTLFSELNPANFNYLSLPAIDELSWCLLSAKENMFFFHRIDDLNKQYKTVNPVRGEAHAIQDRIDILLKYFATSLKNECPKHLKALLDKVFEVNGIVDFENQKKEQSQAVQDLSKLGEIELNLGGS